jgi:hypothetical protein
MCIPAAAIGIGATVAQTLSGYIGAGQADAANEEAYKRASALANEQAAGDYFQLTLRQATEASAAAARIQEIEDESREGMATAVARAAEAGVSGNTVQAVANEFVADQGRAVAMELRNKHLIEAQLQAEKEAVHSRTKAAIFGARPSPAKRPDLLGAIFEVGGYTAEWATSGEGGDTTTQSASTTNTGGD